MILRVATEEDVAELARLYAGSVNAAGPEQYSTQEIASWAAFADEDGFHDFILGRTTLVGEDESGILGFSGVDTKGLIKSLYVRGDQHRRGIGSRLLVAVMDAARAQGVRRFTTVASEFSRGLFEKHDFSVFEVEAKEARGSVFTRYLMETERPDG